MVSDWVREKNSCVHFAFAGPHLQRKLERRLNQDEHVCSRQYMYAWQCIVNSSNVEATLSVVFSCTVAALAGLDGTVARCSK